MRFPWQKEPLQPAPEPPVPPPEMTAEQIEQFEREFLAKCQVLDQSDWLTDEEKVALSNDAREALLKKYSAFMRV